MTGRLQRIARPLMPVAHAPPARRGAAVGTHRAHRRDSSRHGPRADLHLRHRQALARRRCTSSGNSQHLTDWYTPSHVIHGFLFYARRLGHRAADRTGRSRSAWRLARRARRRVRLGDRREHGHRHRPLPRDDDRLDYYGDSVINSVSDILAMVVGFLLARRLARLAHRAGRARHGAVRRLRGSATISPSTSSC